MRELAEIIAQAVKSSFQIDETIELERTDERFGDFSTTIAMKLAKKLSKSPKDIAQTIVEALQDEKIKTAEVAGPGFINLTLADSALLELATQGPAQTRSDTVVIETNNPNPFKAMHIGHALNAITADTIANLIENSGAHTYRVSYHGDVGLHVGKSMYSLLKYCDGNPEKLLDIPENERNSFMSKIYAEGSKVYKESEVAKAEIDKLTKQSFTREDPLYAQIYDTCKDWSFDEIDNTVSRLGNKPVERRFLESDADMRGVKIVRDNTPGVFKESDGALVFEGSKYGAFDNAFVTSRGLGLYGARDLGLMQLKNEYYHPDKSYIVTADEQRDYFKGVLAAAAECFPDWKDVTVNISTGMVKLSTGKMSSRNGEVIEIAWLFEKIAEALRERGGQPDENFIAGALRYQFLKVRIGSDIVFDINESVSIQGNSGPYLQYAHARACSILAKKPTMQGYSLLQGVSLQEGERSLLRKIGEYHEVVERATNELMPHHICTYLYELAQTFNRFYEKNRVIGGDREGLRLQLISLYAQKLESGLSLLGIHAPEKM